MKVTFKMHFQLFAAIIIIILSLMTYNYMNKSNLECSAGYFRLSGMTACHELLDCNDLKDMKPIMLLSRGLVKLIYLVKWKQNHFIVSNLSHPSFKDDFEHNLKMFTSLSPNPSIVQLIGRCGDSSLFTEYHSYGDANNLPRILIHDMPHLNNITFRFKFCVNYVQILNFLHNSPIGRLVMCDSNTIEKTLSQYLLNDNLQLVVNDLDALPVVNGEGIKCGHRQLFGSFVAPEQLWPFNDKPFNDEDMQGYDEKTDIWKIPDICQWFLNAGNNDNILTFNSDINKKLVDIHQKCKIFNPRLRPSAKEVLEEYKDISHLLE